MAEDHSEINIPGLTDSQFEQIIAWANTEVSLSELYVFGSRAGGDFRANSDLDMAYRLSVDDPAHCESDHDRKIQWAAVLSSYTGLHVDLWHVYPSLDVQLWQNIQREGRLVFCRK
jgi:predicted nucleotidyltransferase